MGLVGRVPSNFGNLDHSHRHAIHDKTVLSVSCTVRFGGVNNSRLSPTENMKSEHVDSNCPIHTATSDTTQTELFCSVWCELSRPDRQTGAFSVWSASECDRRTHSDAERTCRAVGVTQFTPPHQTRQDGPVCVVSGARSDFKFSVGDSLELSGIQFTLPKRTRHRQDSFVDFLSVLFSIVTDHRRISQRLTDVFIFIVSRVFSGSEQIGACDSSSL